MIKLNSISKTYESIEILKDISYEFNDTGLYCVIGETGVGKTTLINILGLLEVPDCGEVIIDDNVINFQDMKLLECYRNKYISYVLQNICLFDNLSVFENLLFITNDVEEIYSVLEHMNILSIKNNKCGNLSGGERQRVLLAMSILRKTKILIVDEPTSFLDKENSKLIFTILEEISKDKLVIVVTHNVDDINVEKTIIDLDNKENLIKNEVSLKKETKKSEVINNNNNINFKNILRLLLKELPLKIINELIFYGLFLLSMISVLLTFSLSTTKYNDIYENAIKKYNILDFYLISDDLIEKDTLNCKIEKKENLSLEQLEIMISNNYSRKNITEMDIRFSGSIFSDVIIDDSLNDFEIIITDYELEYLFYSFEFEGSICSSQDLIGRKIKIKDDLFLLIKDVIETNYANLSNDFLIDDLFFAYEYYKSTFLRNSYLNSYTAEKIATLRPSNLETYIFHFEDTESAIHYIQKNNKNLVSWISGEVKSVEQGISEFKVFSTILTIIFIIVLFIYIVYYNICVLEKNRKSNGLLLLIGYSSTSINRLYYIRNTIKFVLSIVFSFVLFFFSVLAFNKISPIEMRYSDLLDSLYITKTGNILSLTLFVFFYLTMNVLTFLSIKKIQLSKLEF